MLDCITQVTETKNKFPGLPLGARAVQIADGSVSTYFLTTFGRATRETVCSCEVKLEPTLSQALHLLNGDTVDAEDRAGQPRRQDGCRRRRPPAQIIEELYVRCLSRAPTPEELKKLAGAGGREPGQEAGAGGRVLGAPELAGVHVQPLTRRTRCRFLPAPIAAPSSKAAAAGLPAWFAAELVRAQEPPKKAEEKPKIALVGCGGMGRGDAKNAQRFGTVVAVCDVDAGRAAQAAKQFGGAKVYADFRKLLEAEKDVAVILNAHPRPLAHARQPRRAEGRQGRLQREAADA